jgi:hypothetical membrane protein
MSAPARSNRTLAALAGAGLSFFIVVVALLPLAQIGHYDIVRQAISELALGSGGWLLNVAFCVMGAGVVALSVMLRRTTRRAVAGPVLLAVAGMLDLVSAIFHAVRYDAPATTAGTVHMIAGIVTFLCTIIAMFAMVRAFRRHPAWQPFARPTLAWACLSAAAFIVLGPGLMGEAHFGVQQRAMAACFMSWMVTTSVIGGRLAERDGSVPSRQRPDREPRQAQETLV